MKNSGDNGEKEIVGRTFRFAVDIVRFCHQLDQQPGVGRVLMSQVARSGTSVGSNVEEAQAAESRADFISKMSIALKEARETNFRLRVLQSAGIQKTVPPEALVSESVEIKRVLGAIVSSTKGTRKT
jgi:four helix bundle protein